MKWIRTLGGPLIALDASLASQWHGDRGPHGSETDYDRAGSMTEWVGSLDLPFGRAVMLAMPNDTTLLKLDASSCLIARIEYADDYDMAEKWLAKRDWGEFEPCLFDISLTSGELLIFDSVFTRDEASEFLDAQVEPGRYDVQKTRATPHEKLSLLLVRWSKCA